MKRIVALFVAFAPALAFAIGEPIAQIKSAPDTESLWHFLAQLPGSMEAQIMYGLPPVTKSLLAATWPSCIWSVPSSGSLECQQPLGD